MLKSFSMEDLEDLYKQVNAKYGSTRPVEDLDLILYGDLKIMFEPHVEDQVWKNQDNYNVLDWKLYDSCRVHSLRMQHVYIHMLGKIVGIKRLLDDLRITAAQVYVTAAKLSGDSGPKLSFDKSASPENLFSLARVSLAEASKPVLSFRCSGETIPHHVPPVWVHFSQLGPLGLNKNLCKQGDCFSFAKRRVPSPFYIDDNRSCMKHWKSGFFFIDQRAILNVMVWRHPDAAIDDLRPAAGSFNMADVRRLSTHVVKLRDMPKGVLVLSGLSQVWKSRICDPVLRGANGNFMGIYNFLCLPEWTGAEVQEEPHLDVMPTLQRLPFYCTPPAAADPVIPEPAPKDLAVGTLVPKLLLRLKLLRSERPLLLVPLQAMLLSSDVDDDACVEIPLVTPLRSAAVIPPSRNHGRSFVAPAAEGSNTRDSRGKGIMVDDAAAPSGGDGVAGNCEFTREEWYAPYRPTFGVLTKEVFKNPTVFKTIMSVLSCMMMSHGGELLARYRGLNQSYHEYVLSIDSRLKGYEEKVASLTGLELQVSTLKKQTLFDVITTSDASFAKSKSKGKERKKKIKSLTKSLDNLHSEVARLSAALNQATILEAEMDEEILRLKATPPEFSSFFRGQFQGLVWKFLASYEFSRVQGELLSLASSAGFERGLSMHWTKDEFVVVLKKMVNFIPSAQDRLVEASLLVAQTDYAYLNKIFEHATEPLSIILQLEPEKLARSANVLTPRDTRASPPIAKESTVYAAVDGSDLEMADSVVPSKSGGVFMQGVSRILDDVVEVAAVESERVSSGPTDVLVALSADGKCDVLIPSFVVGEEAVINSFKI
ncbi:hypothetical protein Tco_0492491 [Tanacetum coccineum]